MLKNHATQQSTQQSIKQRRTGPTFPAYRRIEEDLRSKVVAGHWPAGAMLPSRRDLARDYQVSLNTVERAITELLTEGILRADNGRGTFVADTGREGAAYACTPLIDAAKNTTQPPPVLSRSAARATIGIIARLQPAVERQGVRDKFAESVVNSLERTITSFGGMTRFYNLYQPDTSVVTPNAAAEALLEEGVDAIAFVNAALSHDAVYIPDAVRAATPLVIVSSARSIHPGLYVYYDSRDAGYQAAYHLLENGLQNLLFFSPYTARWVQERAEGIQQAVLLSGLPSHALQISIGDTKLEDVLSFLSSERNSEKGMLDAHAMHEDIAYAAASMLLKNKKGIAAYGVIAANDKVALGFLRAAQENDLLVGRDYALVGFDDSVEARAVGLTTLSPPLEELGQEAGRILRSALASNLSTMQVSLHSHLIVRPSSCLFPDRK